MNAKRLAAVCLAAAAIPGFISGQEKGIGITFSPGLEIGREEMLFASITSLCEDEAHNFYVLDRKECALFKFSPEGRFLAKFGQKGQGPGDFQSPGRVVFASQGELAVLENLAYVSFLRTDGAFIRRLDLNGRLGLGFVGPERYYAWVWRPGDQQQLMLDSGNNVLETFHTIARDLFSVDLPDETGRRVMFNYSHDAYVPRFLFAHGGRLSAVGISDRYEIELLDEQGKTVTTIRRDLKPRKFSRRERRYLERGLREFVKSKSWPDRVARELAKKIPAHKNAIQAVRISPRHVFVFRFPADISAQEAPSPVDIFGRTGEFLGTAEFPAIPLFLSDGSAYYVRTDEAGNLYLSRRGYHLVL